METIKVNMTPCEDIKTIHASQNDGEAREWGFALHNNGDVIDSSEISDQLVFKAYKGGTEQILPENGSTPTTSPFIGDIRYPQGLLTDQEFAYRESPTESDGLAKITDIKGNTLVWYQQLNDTGSTTTTNGITFTKNADGSITLNGTATAQADYTFARFDYINGHKYLINGIPSGATVNGYRAFLFSTNETSNRIITTTRDDWFTPRIRVSEGVTVSNVVFRLNIFDLTKMGLDSITSVEEFTSLFPSFYAYNQGTLLSFNGNGIKTVGKNLLAPTATFPQTLNGVTFTLNSDGSVTANGTAGSGGSTLIYWDKTTYGGKLLADGTYKLSGITSGSASTYSIRTNGFGGVSITGGESSFTITDSLPQTNIIITISNNVTVNNVVFKPMIRRANITDNTFEPHTSSTLSLPISTYFPTGMKDVPDGNGGKIYDKLTPSKATTRVSSVDLGTLNWYFVSSSQWNCFSTTVSDKANGEFNLVNAKYTVSSVYGTTNEKIICGNRNAKAVYVRDSSYADATAFKTAMSGVYLYYESATPTETSFTTASLVTENAEIPLSNEDGVLIGRCTEQLSSESGFFDAKIKLADEDGECYSNKLQLHIERSPQ